METKNIDFSSYIPTPEQTAVIASGIVSMGLEIVAGRVLAPEFGSSIYTWGSIIGISMLALSLGYHFGGKRSSSIESVDLDRFLVYTSVYIVALLYLGDMILSWSAGLPVPQRYASIIPVSMLFGPPTYFLGYISPYAVQLSSKEEKGEASGHFYAVGTAGSILGAFGTTFVLIPYLGVNQIYILFASLVFLPVLYDISDKRFLIAGLMLIAAIFIGSSGSLALGDVVYSDSTAYQDLKVTDSGNVRTLYLDGQPQSAMYLDDTQGYPWDYPDYFHIPLLMRDDVDKALFIGGGGFTIPQKFAEENITVHAVEIDPGVIEAAEKTFNLTESENLQVYNSDGRQFLQESNHTYDVIYIDAYRKSKVPFHLTTEEFMELAYQKTDENGIVASNVISAASGSGSKFARSQYKTMASVYESVYYFPTNQRLSQVQNVEIIASKNPMISEDQLLERNSKHSGLNLSSHIQNLAEAPDTEDVPLLQDNYAPVDRLLKSQVGREYVID
jgi:spermidine synthase